MRNATIAERQAQLGMQTGAFVEHLTGIAGGTVAAGGCPVTTVAAAGSSSNTLTIPAGVTGQRKLVALTAKGGAGNLLIQPFGWVGAPIELRMVETVLELQWLRGGWRPLTPLFRGTCATAAITFSAVAEAGASVTIGGRVYTEGAGQQWLRGASAGASATALAAAINTDAGSLFTAFVAASGTAVILAAKTPGTAGNVSVSKVSAAAIAVENAHDGTNARPGAIVLRRAVTVQEVTANEVNIPLPFTPVGYAPSYLTSAGVPKTVDAPMTVGTSPDRLVVINSGSTDLVAGDVVCVAVSP